MAGKESIKSLIAALLDSLVMKALKRGTRD